MLPRRRPGGPERSAPPGPRPPPSDCVRLRRETQRGKLGIGTRQRIRMGWGLLPLPRPRATALSAVPGLGGRHACCIPKPSRHRTACRPASSSTPSWAPTASTAASSWSGRGSRWAPACSCAGRSCLRVWASTQPARRAWAALVAACAGARDRGMRFNPPALLPRIPAGAGLPISGAALPGGVRCGGEGQRGAARGRGARVQ